MHKSIGRSYYSPKEICSREYDGDHENAYLIDEMLGGFCYEIVEETEKLYKKYIEKNKNASQPYIVAFMRLYVFDLEFVVHPLFKIKQFAEQESCYSGWGNTSMFTAVRFADFFTQNEKTYIERRMSINTVKTQCSECKKSPKFTCNCRRRFCEKCARKIYPNIDKKKQYDSTWCSHCNDSDR
uniref:Uncharacterized protein n=1 Tax=Marseillevirus LCMAC201 TaxID=2506605 RepID=A0A481YWG2_9VIRU|nr:MAG: hypothetical protein LCMAC201_01330 [Marseillevirus LCMAC201]